MEAAQTAIPEFQYLKNIKTYNVKIKELNYTLSISDNSNQLNLSLTQKEGNDPFEYGESYNLDSLIEINNIFKTFDSISDVRSSFEELLNTQRYSFEKNSENIKLILKIPNFAKTIEVSLFLRQKKFSTENLINVLSQQINDLKIKHEQDINELKKEIKEIKEQNNFIMDSYMKLLFEQKNQRTNDYFSYCFRNGNNYTLSNNGKIAEKTSGDGIWNCTIIGDTEIPKNKLSKWKIKLKKFKITGNTINIFIGIGPNNPKNKINFYEYCWSLSCGDPCIWNKKKSIKYNNYPGNLKEGDIIEVIVDMSDRILSFTINGIDYGVAFNDIPVKEKLYPIVLINNINQIVEIME